MVELSDSPCPVSSSWLFCLFKLGYSCAKLNGTDSPLPGLAMTDGVVGRQTSVDAVKCFVMVRNRQQYPWHGASIERGLFHVTGSRQASD
jgi:hypothetical protein